jgi:hypothetical protein
MFRSRLFHFHLTPARIGIKSFHGAFNCNTKNFLCNARQNGLIFNNSHLKLGYQQQQQQSPTFMFVAARQYAASAKKGAESGKQGSSASSAISKVSAAATGALGAVPKVFNFAGRLVLLVLDIVGFVIGWGRNIAVTSAEIAKQVVKEHKVALVLDIAKWKVAMDWLKTSTQSFFARGWNDFTWGEFIGSFRVFLGLLSFYFFGLIVARTIKEIHLYLKKVSIYKQRKNERLAREAAGHEEAKESHTDHH